MNERGLVASPHSLTSATVLNSHKLGNDYISEIKLRRNYPSIMAGAGLFRSNPKSLVASTRSTDPRSNLI
jgi:hypothetical protein